MKLSESFLNQYPDFPAEMNALGKFVYYRTYSRWIPEKRRRETWKETCIRAVEYNATLGRASEDEAQAYFDNMFHLRTFLSGRTMWVGGTDVVKYHSTSNFNCAFTKIATFKDIAEIFTLLMVGTGVGFRILKEDVEKLPPVRQDIKVIHKPYHAIRKGERLEGGCRINLLDSETAEIVVSDDKLGWSQSVHMYLTLLTEAMFSPIKTIIINYDNVRPKGERLKTFGGQASGHESLKTMFEKIDNVINTDKYAPKPKDGVVRPIHVLDICNIIAENVKAGGVRRSSEIALLDPEDTESIEAKANLTPEKYHRFMSNNSIYYETKPTMEQLHRHLELIRINGEPGFLNAYAAKLRKPDFEGTNPCFTGDMKILTKDGYVPIGTLEGMAIELINKDGSISNGKVWCSGKKPVVKINFANRSAITCTEDHKFMLIDGTECLAKDLVGKRLMPYLSKPADLDETFIRYGYIQGDGGLGRLKSKEHRGIEINIGGKDLDVAKIFGLDKTDGKRAFYIHGYNDALKLLQFSSEPLPTRDFPKTYKDWSILQKQSFLCGCYSANGSVIKTGRVTYKTTSKAFADNLIKTLLEDFGIEAYLTTNKPTEVKFSNGTYTCKESYDINVQNYLGRVAFYEKIGFVQHYKTDRLHRILIEQSPMVNSITRNHSIEKVYDFTEPVTHWGVVEGVVAHNCGEVLLKSKGLCNLVTTNAMAFVENGRLKRQAFIRAHELNARAALRMTLVDLEMLEWDKSHKEDRVEGVAIMGWYDMLDSVGIEANSREEHELQVSLRQAARYAVERYVEELGIEPPKLITTMKPDGTLSKVAGGVSPGAHRNRAPYYIRRIRINAHDPLCRAVEELGWVVKNEVGQGIEIGGKYVPVTTKVVEFPVACGAKTTIMDVSAEDQLNTYYNFQKNYTDHNTSITITVRQNEWDLVEQSVWDNWDTVVGATFIAHDTTAYDLLPEEPITKEEYELRKSAMKDLDPDLLNMLELELDNAGEDFDISGEQGCENGSCPLR